MFVVQNPEQLGLVVGFVRLSEYFAHKWVPPDLRCGPAGGHRAGFWAYPMSYPCFRQIGCPVAMAFIQVSEEYTSSVAL
ncbi:hypothetical protein GCM10023319_70420 [Nocardia iowensis]